MSHAANILAQLRQAETDESLPEQLRDKCRGRAEEIEEEINVSG